MNYKTTKMEILTKQQKVLNLILQYWDNPSEFFLQDTLKQIREYWPIDFNHHSESWEFSGLTDNSWAELSKKYSLELREDKNNDYTLVVYCSSLLMKIISREQFIEYFTAKMKTTFWGVDMSTSNF